jgi:hypothetical protein
MSDSTRRRLVRAFLLVAILGAAGLMISSVVDPQARTVLHAASLIACVGSGVVSAILAHNTEESAAPRKVSRW